jgi:putative methyltransferase (TIGR04325 family)
MRSIAAIVKDWCPPALVSWACLCKNIVTRSGYSCLGPAWPKKFTGGWTDDSIVEPRRDLFLKWRQEIAGMNPLGCAAWPPVKPYAACVETHNRYMCFAYTLCLAAQQKKKMKVLDWGGACGDYLLLAKKLLPGVEFEWHCVEPTSICRLGREVNPEVIFHDTQSSWEMQQFDFCFSSSALQYVADWPNVLAALAAVSCQWLFITRIPVIFSSPAYVFIQRTPAYRTAYPGWALNHDELIGVAANSGFGVFQEFMLGPWGTVHKASEQPVNMGFLFRRL